MTGRFRLAGVWLSLPVLLTLAACGEDTPERAGPTPTATPMTAAASELQTELREVVDEYVTRLRAGRRTCDLRAKALLEAETGRTGRAARSACRRDTPARSTAYAADAATRARLLSAGQGRARVEVESRDGKRRFLFVYEDGAWELFGIGSL